MHRKIFQKLTLVCAVLLLAGAASARADFGELTVLKGKAIVERADEKIEVSGKIKLLDEDRIRTLAGSKAHVRLTGPPAGAEAIVTADTTFSVHELSRRQAVSPLRLLFGAIRSRVARSFRTVPFIGSPTAVVGIKGTDFIVYVKKQTATEFIGVDGLIEAESRSRPEYAIRIGRRQWGEIVEGEKPKPPVRVPDEVWEAALKEFSFPG